MRLRPCEGGGNRALRSGRCGPTRTPPLSMGIPACPGARGHPQIFEWPDSQGGPARVWQGGGLRGLSDLSPSSPAVKKTCGCAFYTESVQWENAPCLRSVRHRNSSRELPLRIAPPEGPRCAAPGPHGAFGAFAMNYRESWVGGDDSGTGNQFWVKLTSYSASPWAFRRRCDFSSGEDIRDISIAGWFCH